MKGPAAIAPGGWGPLAVGFFLYVVMFVTGYFLGKPELNNVGGLTMVYFALLGNYRSMFHLEYDAPTRWALLAIVAFIASWMANPVPEALGLTFKYVLIFVLFIRVHSSRLPRLASSRWRLAFFVLVAALLAFSVISGRTFEQGDDRRLSGIFRNPNNLALMALSLLFLVSDRDPLAVQVLAHGLVVAMLGITRTLGAILAYSAGIAYRFRTRLWRLQSLPVVVLLAVALAVAGGNLLASQDRLLKQFQVMNQNVEAAVAGRVEYGELVDAYGDSSTSGLWRIAMWTSVLVGYVRGGPREWLFGSGIGSAPQIYGNHPHNEYLRLLAETGAFGLVAFLGFFVVVIRGLRPEERYLPLVFLVYSFSENNLDNFVFMTVLVLFLGSALQPGATAARPGRAGSSLRPRRLAQAGGPTR